MQWDFENTRSYQDFETRNKEDINASQVIIWKSIRDPSDESTPFNPRSPYAVAKLYSYYITKNYRKLINFLPVMEFYLIMNLLER